MLNINQAISVARSQEALGLFSPRRKNLENIKQIFQSQYPITIRALKIIDHEFTAPKRRKGFNLVKRENKKSGFLYYVRYSDGGKTLPSMWNTHTNILAEAEKFARENKKRIVAEYLERREKINIFVFFENYFQAGSECLEREEQRNREFSEKHRKFYHNTIKNSFIPFLRERKINDLNKITAALISDFQDYLLNKNIKRQTVNNSMGAVKKIFSYLVNKGKIKDNPFNNVKSLSVRKEDQRIRGCHEIESLNGVFNKEWENSLSYHLCLMIYSTGLRNNEIEKIRVQDIIKIEDCTFISVKTSKTINGIRLVPLNNKVHTKLCEYIKKEQIQDYLFTKRGGSIQGPVYNRANSDLALKLNKSEEEINKENITFYSGRHYWKTLLNAGGLGEDIEEIFMGHKISSDVAKRYNHKDKQGKGNMLAKARQVCTILDKTLLAGFECYAGVTLEDSIKSKG
ncbi:MAG: tyrosine-type recombinase/integrase [Spirochaetaceae bacterium]|jgi:site-specific recombinase XerD|nr:tyrosine-type recombinase/integrase [Spirochaetaceae bacterium]